LALHFHGDFLRFVLMAAISKPTFGFLYFRFIILMLALGWLSPAFAADTNSATADAAGKSAEAGLIGSEQSLRSLLQVQEQLHNTQMAIEKNREEAKAESARNSLILEERFGVMEKNLAAQRLEDLKGIEHSDRMVLIAAGIFAGIGFLVLLMAAFLQWTAVNRLSLAAASISNAYPPQGLGMGESQVLSSKMLEQSTSKFLEVIARLEQRVQELEGSSKPATALPENGVNHDDVKKLALTESNEEMPPMVVPNKTDAVSVLLSKCQTLLKLDKPEDALDCLDQALAMEPGNADALLKRGAALERLQRFTEAIECYDRAIAQDNSMTMAYLYKGGVFNRMERYSEALECYEQALKTRQKGHAANVIME
jgi:tetratricopeptide (TPR) repeat protein